MKQVQNETSTKIETWKIQSLLNWAIEYLKSKNISEPRLTSELILSNILNQPRIFLYTNFDKELSKNDLSEFKKNILKILDFEPVQYVIGETSFYGNKIKCSNEALIPRPETEILVEKTFELSKKISGEIRILDIGTGTGCIAIALKKLVPHAKIIAIDFKDEILSVAKENAQKLNLEIDFRKINILNEKINEKFNFIISNPPYISTVEYETLSNSVKNYEPKNSLTDNSNGLTFYNRFAEIFCDMLYDDGYCLLEHAFNQREDLLKIFKNFTIVETFNDYSKINRGIIFKK